MAEGRNCNKEVLPFAVMFMVECTNVGSSTIFKAATLKGMSYCVFMVYSFSLSSLVLLTLAFIHHRKTPLPPFNRSLVPKFCLLGLLVFLALILGYKGIDYGSPTLASALSNLMPACTFILAIIFRMEKLELRSSTSQAKIVGTITIISGALVVILYEGPSILRFPSSPSVSQSLKSQQSDWAIGGLLLASEYFVASVCYILQAQMMKEYPAELVAVFLNNLCSAIISTPVCLMLEPNLSSWKLNSHIALLSVLYAGVIGSSFGSIVHMWALRVKGPVYVALFRPLSIAIAAVMGFIFLHGTLYLGSIVGSIIISVGFYVLMWGKAKEGTGRAMAWRRYCCREVLPFSAMVMVEGIYVGLNTLFKAATLKGMSPYVFIVYTCTIAALFLLPFAFFSVRRTVLPPLKRSLFYKMFLLGLVGSLSQMLEYKGIEYSSPMLDSALSNLIPAFTFILAIFFRLEKLALRTSSSQAKIMGTVVSVSGAFIVILYKGPAILTIQSQSSVHDPLRLSPSDWVIGGLMLAAVAFLVSVWYILQAQIMKEYPAELIVVFFYNLSAAIISAAVCLIADMNLNDWKITADIALVSIVCQGLLKSSFGNVVHSWGLRLKGPVYLSLFKPFSIAIAAVMGVVFLGESLYLGSVVGAVVISFGFYAVMWGKAKEEMGEEFGVGSLESTSTPKAPLLQSSRSEER